MAITPEALFKYSTRFCKRSEKKGLGSIYPTFKQAAARFKCTYDDIEQACSDWDADKGYMQPAVGLQCPNGFAGYNHRGEYLVEAYT